MGDTCPDSSRNTGSNASHGLNSQLELSSQHGPTDVGDDPDYDPHYQVCMQTGEGAASDEESLDEDEDLSDENSDAGDHVEGQVL